MQGGKDFVSSLYNDEKGSFAYGCQLNGTGRRDDIMFSGMLAGQMLSRHAGWGDLPVSMKTALSSLLQSRRPLIVL